MLRTNVRPTATMGPTGIRVEYLSEPARGSTALTDSTAMLIIATILITVTVAPCPAAEESRSTTSTATRRGTDEATQATPAMMRGMNAVNRNPTISPPQNQAHAPAPPPVAQRRENPTQGRLLTRIHQLK